MMIAESELVEFANNPFNKIEMGDCDANAIKIFTKYQGEMYMGVADYISNDGTKDSKPHCWNVLKLISCSGEEIVQIIDIINYKVGTSGTYKNYREAVKVSKEYIEKNRQETKKLIEGIEYL